MQTKLKGCMHLFKDGLHLRNGECSIKREGKMLKYISLHLLGQYIAKTLSLCKGESWLSRVL